LQQSDVQEATSRFGQAAATLHRARPSGSPVHPDGHAQRPGAPAERASRLVLRLAAVLAVLVAGTAFAATRAYADSDETALRSWGQGQCIDTNADGSVLERNCNGWTSQKWHLRFESSIGDYTNPAGVPGYNIPNGKYVAVFHIVDSATGKCLDSNFDGVVYTNPCQDGNQWQEWAIASGWDSLNNYVLNIWDIHTARCLDANLVGAPIYTNGTCYTGGYQDWKAEQ
jgi:hypothetical protein